MNEFKEIKLFITCPSDIEDEIISIGNVVKEINKTSGRQNKYRIETINWKEDVYFDMGEDIQDVINNSMESEYDVLLGLMWQKIGTPTKRDKSGTIEEINRALDNPSKLKMVYFNISAPLNLKNFDVDELKKVQDFKHSLFERGCLYKEYDGIENFESLFRIDLSNMILEKLIMNQSNSSLTSSSDENVVLEAEVIDNNRYAEIQKYIDDVDEKDQVDWDVDLFSLVEESTSNLNSLTSSLNTMTGFLNDFGHNLDLRNKEINVVSNIKDTRLREGKVKVLMNILADEFDYFKDRIANEVPNYNSYFNNVGTSYSKIILAIGNVESDDVTGMKESMLVFRDAVESSMNDQVKMMKSIEAMPLLNRKFNKSKRDTEIVMNDLLKATLNGLVLLDSATYR